MNKVDYIKNIRQLLDELPYLASGVDEEIIYQIDDINVYGDFEQGYRGVDHNILKYKNITWEQILTYGVVVVPETQTYISDEPIGSFEKLGYCRVPTTDNHIVGV